MSKGSIWNIWDFHLHTPCSALNNQFGDPESDATWNEYIDKVEETVAQTGIVALGITDYFTIEGYKRLREYQKKGRLPNVLLIPNIEFRIDKIIYRSQGKHNPKRINLHVLFSPSVQPNEIEENFLHDLEFINDQEPFNHPKKRKLKINNLTEFGEMLKNQQNGFNGSAFEIGCLNATVNCLQIKEILEANFRGQYLIILANENLESMSWDSQDHATRKQLIQMSHAIFSSSNNDRDFYLGRKHTSVDNFLDEFKSLKPCLWGCDSHGYQERFLRPDMDRFCWVKGDVTWEGLLQVIYEPEERIKIQPNNPEPAKSIYSISNIKVDGTSINPSLSFDLFDSGLNNNLVTIIGGRGSGKTALLDLIASCFIESKKLAEIENSFFFRLFGNGQKKNANKPVTINIVFGSNQSYCKNIGSDSGFFPDSNIIYLTQNHFDEYTENPERLYEHIINLVFENYLEKKQEFDSIKQNIDVLEKEIQQINLKIQQLRCENEGKKENVENDLKMKIGERFDLMERARKMQRYEIDNEILKITSNLEELKNKRAGLQKLLGEMNSLEQTIHIFFTYYSSAILEINGGLQNLMGINTPLIPDQIIELTKIQDMIFQYKPTIVQLDKTIENDITVEDKKISDLQGNDRVIAEYQKKINDLASVINSLESQIQEIDGKEKEISTLENRRRFIFLEIIRQTINLRDFLQQIITNFEENKDDILQSLSFSAMVETEKGKRQFLQNLLSQIDNRNTSENDLCKLVSPFFDELEKIFDTNEVVDEKEIMTAIDNIDNIAKQLKLRKKTNEAEIYNVIFGKNFWIGLKIKFYNKSLNDLSMGERAIVLLKILLALGDMPLLIDQPEEHLDNRYIYEELTPAFRNAKKRRQIIIATHNANLVVNTDAEQIIVAEHINGTLTYRSGTLENLEIRETIKQILEGGDEAFRKREEKYGMRY